MNEGAVEVGAGWWPYSRMDAKFTGQLPNNGAVNECGQAGSKVTGVGRVGQKLTTTLDKGSTRMLQRFDSILMR